MKVYFGGAEKGSHRNLLLSNGIQRVGVNLTHLAIPKTKEFNLQDVYQNAEILLYTSEGDEDVSRYGDFVRSYADDLSVIIGRPDFDGEFLGDKYVPVWSDGDDLERLEIGRAHV